MIPHEELNDQSSLQALETAREEWIELALDGGFVELCSNLAILLGEFAYRIEGPRKEATDMHVWANSKVEVAVIVSTGNYIERLRDYEIKHVVLAGRGTWPQYDELYCNVVLSNDDRRELEPYEIFIPGKWQDEIEMLRPAIETTVDHSNSKKDGIRKTELIEQLLIGKEV